MRHIFLLQLLFSFSFSQMNEINSFEANFIQTITDEHAKELTYKGHIQAQKPQKALWTYINPVEKKVYINAREIVIVEPEIEQVIIKKISNEFDFFSMMKNAKQIDKNLYVTTFKETQFKIIIENSIIQSISYRDEFDNEVKIKFTKQIQNKEIDKELFRPLYPLVYDVIRG